ncbi:MAG: hypothetical protein HY422_02105 [Candidatus Komeilibacteria bacterium]|nr:hypothetical protein [Candidatus Komeilibacteria bacterium]
MTPKTHAFNERTASEIFLVALIAFIALSVMWGYWKITVLHDFTIFTNDEEIERYVPLPENLES